VKQQTLVHLLRHGEVHNPDKVLYGRLPGFRLSDAGSAMAQAAAEVLRTRDVAHLVSSPLERAQQTARPLADVLGLDVRLDARLVEAGNHFEGRPLGQGVRGFMRVRDVRLLRNPFTPSWGEPYSSIAARVLAAVDDARSVARGREAVLVSHQLPIYITRRAAEGRRLWHRPDRRQCALASLTTLVFRGDDLAAVRYSEPAGEASRHAGPPGA
jgi:broad specificity phosphatase PhoE